MAITDLENLGVLIDRLDTIARALNLPLRDAHVTALRESLPKLVRDFKMAYANELGENPWEGEPED